MIVKTPTPITDALRQQTFHPSNGGGIDGTPNRFGSTDVNKALALSEQLETENAELKKNLVSAVESVLEIRDLLDPNGTLSVFDAVHKIREEMQSAKRNLMK